MKRVSFNNYSFPLINTEKTNLPSEKEMVNRLAALRGVHPDSTTKPHVRSTATDVKLKMNS